ncbi:MAG: sarcosine oxidase subunit alpha family protein [Alsobacter sp.]
MTSYRLPSGGRIDRAATLSFTFDGQPFAGHPGDTLASALLANGRRLVGRSFKYHRPRGIVTAGSAEPNALVTVGRGGRREPNVRATMLELHEGLVAESQNRWPSLGFDVGAVNGLLGPFLSAGFYYKTFMWPAAFWERLYEPIIRKAAGLGRAGFDPDPDGYEKSWAHCDLLVVGGGPAGLAAALTAGRAGAQVVLLDEGAEPGGTLLHETAMVGGHRAGDALGAMLDELRSLPNVRMMPRTTAFGWYDEMVFGALERVQKHVGEPGPATPVERLWRIIARRALLCTGAEERPIVFGGNDRPGVMMAEAGLAYALRQGVGVGRSVAVFTTGAAGLHVAKGLEAAGVHVAAVADARQDAAVVATSGGRGLSGVTIARGGTAREVSVDALLMSGGHSPRIHLACHRGGKPRWSEAHGAFLAPEGSGCLPLAGSAAGARTLAQCLADGAGQAAAILSDLGRNAQPASFGAIEGDWEDSPARILWRVEKSRGKAFVDFQNDVHEGDLGLAAREGYDHVELAKRYTTTGMATDQGKLSNVNAIGILAQARGVTPAEVGTTTFRPFYTPVSFGALAGHSRGPHFQPVRNSPLHGWAARHGAEFVETGLWFRSSHFPIEGETHWRQTVDREALAVRASVGLCDVSTLGKIEIVGRDAATFLDRIYCNPFAKLPLGKARYGLMLREDGFIYDDGTTSRLGEQRYFMTTTTAAAAQVMRHLEFCSQAIWPDLDVRLTSVTDQWAQMALAGPRSREVLRHVVDQDVSNDAFPHLAAAEVTLLGGQVEGRLFRLSFSGELAYEIAVPAGFGEAVADALMAAGAPFGIVPYGLEAMGVLRIEKGHVTHNEINGTVTAADLGFGRMVSRTKADFIGRRMLDREGLVDPARPALVGIMTLAPSDPLRAGSHILRKGDAATLENDQGYVTSGCYSPHLGSSIGLALVTRGPERHGEEVVVWNALNGEFVPARLVPPVFVDPTNGRLHG